MSSSLIMKENSTLTFRGKAIFERGGYVQLEEGAEIDIGQQFSANSGFLMTTDKKVEIGNGVLVGWNVTIIGADGHNVMDKKTGKITNEKKKTVIGNHVWLCSESHILKGSQITDGCIVGYRSLVNGKHATPNALIVGSPAKEIAYDREWRA